MCKELNEEFLFINMKHKPELPTNESFGKRLVEIRKAKGITQEELARKIGSTQRMIAYYEGQTTHIPANKLLSITKALRISADELIGIKKEEVTRTEHAALWRRLKKTEQLSPNDQKAVCYYIDALLSKKSNPNKNGSSWPCDARRHAYGVTVIPSNPSPRGVPSVDPKVR